MAGLTTWSEFWSTFVFNIVIALVLVVVYFLLHTTEFFRRLHAARMLNEEEESPVKRMRYPFDWILPVWRASEEEIASMAGLDGVVFLRMFVFSIQLLVILNVLFLPILLPLHASSTIDQSGSSSVDEFSSSNLSASSDKLWANFALLCTMSVCTCGLMWWTYHHMWLLRHEFLAERARKQHPEEFTLLLTDVPRAQTPPESRVQGSRNLMLFHSESESVPNSWYYLLRMVSLGIIRGPVKEQQEAAMKRKSAYIDQFFRSMYGDNYVCNQGVMAVRKSQKLYREWDKACRNLQRAVWAYEKELLSHRGDPFDASLLPWHRVGLCGPRVESISYWLQQVKEKDAQLKKEQDLDRSRRVTGSAFVSFDRRRVSSVAAQTEHSIKGDAWRLQLAPEPEDVIWPNVALKLWERRLRSHMGIALTVVIIVFFYVPVTFVAGLTTVEKVVQLFPFLKQYLSDQWFNGFFSSFLPSLTLRIMLWIVPPLLMLLARFQGCISYSQMQRSASNKHFFILLFNVFLGYTFTGTLLSQLQAIINKPNDVVKILATSIPQASSFFINYVVVSSLLFLLELLCFPIPIIRYAIQIMWLGKDVADREKLWNQGGIAYHVFVPYQNLIITFGLVFAVISPLMLPFVLLYSIIGYFVWKHQILFVYSSPYQTGGLMWPQFVNHVFVALLLSQLTAMGEFGLKQGYYEAALTIPVIVATSYCWVLINNQFNASFKVLPLELACAVDVDNQNDRVRVSVEDMCRKYQPRCLIETGASRQELVERAGIIVRFVEGERELQHLQEQLSDIE